MVCCARVRLTLVLILVVWSGDVILDESVLLEAGEASSKDDEAWVGGDILCLVFEVLVFGIIDIACLNFLVV